MADTPDYHFRGDTNEKPLSHHDWSGNGLWEETGDLISGMNDCVENGAHTKDFPVLNRKTHIDVFVYGTLKNSFRNHKTLGPRPELLGVGHTTYDRFLMARHTKSAFPIAYFHSDETYRARIYGEVYRIITDRILQLDYLESNGIMFKRHFLPIDIVQRDGSIQKHNAWTYLGVKDYWKDREEHLELARRHKPNNGDKPYYIFTLADED